MQKTLLNKLYIIVGLCIIFAVGLTMFRTVISERQHYADIVVAEEIAEQHVNPQEVITPFIAIPTTVTPECLIDSENATKCKPSYSAIETIFATQTQAIENLKVSTDTYQRGVYHATSYDGNIKFDQNYALGQYVKDLNYTPSIDLNANETQASLNTELNTDKLQPKQTVFHWNEAKLIIPVSDLRGVAITPTVTINNKQIKATYPKTPMIKGLTYVEVPVPQDILNSQDMIKPSNNGNLVGRNGTGDIGDNLASQSLSISPDNSQTSNLSNDAANAVVSSTETVISEADKASKTDALKTGMIKIIIDLPLSGISSLNTVPTGQSFTLAMQSNWHAPNFIGKALPNMKNFTSNGFEANWQNEYLTVANNQRLSQCLSTPNNQCSVISKAGNPLGIDDVVLVEEGAATSRSANSTHLNSFGVSFAEPNDVYLQTERTLKYALLLILVSFGTFFLFEVIKSSRIHPIQYLLVGCALLVFYVLLLPLAEQIAFWKAYAIAATACVGLIGWYTYYVLNGVKRALIFTTILTGLYAAFYRILTVEDLNLLLGAVFCFVVLASVMVLTRKIDWYQVT
ncbi:cell envelope integrity protein CreD [Psychrobacter sp. P11G5]|uniref:cell envelope integrity protein CreD n=1 Tax=Psychrobacter sp. P11G5 TaxID=1699624 RepID=UPI000830EF3B|nr:cell envelope integrity protein CreD [Psychrobacter sp. P11G5]